MSDESYPLTVPASAVHKAVRNILVNEFKLDPARIRDEVVEQALANAKATAEMRLDGYLERHGGSAHAIAIRVDRILEGIMRKVLEEKAESWFRREFDRIIRESLELSVRTLVEKGTEIRVDFTGWNRVKVTRPGEAPAEGEATT